MSQVTAYSRIAGCLLGGAVGDALGAPVEFLSLAEIRARFGPNGISDLAPAYGRIGAITDDTQMTLFTAEGLLRALAEEPGTITPVEAVYEAYLDWLLTQGETPPLPRQRHGRLVSVPDLHAWRAPGGTCLSALRSGRMGTLTSPLNNSKGCGGVMRVAPAGLVRHPDPFTLGCELAAVTHGHPSGYLAAGYLAAVVQGLLDGLELAEAATRTLDVLQRWPGHEECARAVEHALRLARQARPEPETVELLGSGWVAEEALAIALFCALTARDFADGVRRAVNHSGDSDSTGAITGNLLGARWGVDAIPTRWLDQLELQQTISAIAADITRHFWAPSTPSTA